ncbi:cobalt ECF transporter T component CbiQ [Mycolicibacterium goodii]|uniref:Cobalt ECF transporter T component CbiQ n=1 Tax=Mycolicibacterium goodii TaxID=134601 RepID=A0A0K0X8Y9_MYCGD|nr:hypothetical protein AFA91_20205 [Mycolicibacterium goodii]
MTATPLDVVAWASRWRTRSVAEKVVLCGGLMMCALLLPPWPTTVIVMTTVCTAARHAGVPILHLQRMLRVPGLFILVAGLSTAFTPNSSWPPLTTSGSALLAAGATVARSFAATAAMLLFASTTPMSDLTNALRRVGLPAACVDVITVMYRMVFLLLESLTVVRRSQTGRLGYSNARRSLRSAGLLIAAVLTRAWQRAYALERGLSGREVGATSAKPDKRPVSTRFIFGATLTNTMVIALSLASHVVVR